jgi:hypothetical protein
MLFALSINSFGSGDGVYTAMDIPHNTTWEIKK